MKLTNREIHLVLADKNQTHFEFHIDQVFDRSVCTIISNVFLYDKQKEIIKKHLIREFKKIEVTINIYKFRNKV